MPKTNTETRTLRYSFIVILLLILFARLTFESRQLSFTTDEPSHLASGYAYLSKGETWTTPLRGHPLLIDAWNALPLFVADPDIPLEELNGWQEDNTRYVKAFSPYLAKHVERNEFASRVPMMLVAVILASVITRWASDLWGSAGGVFALLILLFDPLTLGHSMLATNDVGVIALGTLALFLTYRLGRRKASVYQTVVIGLTYGMTMLAKGSGVIWLAAGILMMILRLSKRRNGVERMTRWLRQSVMITAIALLTVWAFYGFEIGSGSALPFAIPAPAHWESILMQSGSPSDRSVYYLGRVENEGWWGYFPLAFSLKNPLPFLVLILWGLARSFHLKRPQDLLALSIFPIIYTIVAVSTGLNIGYRHFLPVHPFLYLSGAAVITSRRSIRIFGIGLLIWMGLESILIAPNHIAYFNQIAGGPNEGWRYLADSNTDWGQSYKYLSDFLDNDHNATENTLYYSGPAGYLGLETYGIEASPLPPLPSNPDPIMEPWIRPAPGRYVISANSLSGLGCTAPDNYAWFRFQEPNDIIGHILFVYEVNPLSENTWVAQCSKPIPPLQNEEMNRAFPGEPVRTLHFDCAQSWIIPDAEATYGWYVLHDEQINRKLEWLQRIGVRPIVPEDDFVADRLETLPISYRQWDYRRSPAFAVYASPGDRPLSGPTIHEGYSALAGANPNTLKDLSETPVTLEGPLSYLGAQYTSYSENVEILTWWKVKDSSPPSRPLSIMAHLLNNQGQSLGIADGLGVLSENWQMNDTLIQRHTFEVPKGQDLNLWLRTGVYWLDTGDRWQIADGQGDAIFVDLEMSTQ